MVQTIFSNFYYRHHSDYIPESSFSKQRVRKESHLTNEQSSSNNFGCYLTRCMVKSESWFRWLLHCRRYYLYHWGPFWWLSFIRTRVLHLALWEHHEQTWANQRRNEQKIWRCNEIVTYRKLLQFTLHSSLVICESSGLSLQSLQKNQRVSKRICKEEIYFCLQTRSGIRNGCKQFICTIHRIRSTLQLLGNKL